MLTEVMKKAHVQASVVRQAIFFHLVFPGYIRLCVGCTVDFHFCVIRWVLLYYLEGWPRNFSSKCELIYRYVVGMQLLTAFVLLCF